LSRLQEAWTTAAAYIKDSKTSRERDDNLHPKDDKGSRRYGAAPGARRRRQPVYQRHPDEIDAWLITEEHGEDDGRTAAPPGKHHLRLR